jgi:hypothetical protein
MSNSMKVSFAPEKLWQAINPLTIYQQGAQFGFINIDLGDTQQPELERTILDKVGSYGRQLGRIGDALEVILKCVNLDGISKDEKDAISVLRGQLAEVRQAKEQARANTGTSASGGGRVQSR